MTWTTAFGDHIIEKHIFSIWILRFCFVKIYVFVGSPLSGATFLAGQQSWLLSTRNCVPSTISTSLAQTPDRFLCFAEEKVVKMMRWWGDEDGGHGDENGGHGDEEGVHYDEDGGDGDQDKDFSFPCNHLQVRYLFVLLWTPRVILGIDRCVCIDSMYVYHRFTDCTYWLKHRMNITWSVRYYWSR